MSGKELKRLENSFSPNSTPQVPLKYGKPDKGFYPSSAK